MSSIFSSLNVTAKDEKGLLAFYAMYSFEKTPRRGANEIQCVLSISREKQSNLAKTLAVKGLLCSAGYDWHTESHNYSIDTQYILAVMTALFTEEKELLEKVKISNAKLPKSELQKVFWKYVESDFTKVPQLSEDFCYENNVEYALSPYVCDYRFHKLLYAFEWQEFYSAVDTALCGYFSNEKMMDTGCLRQLVDGYPGECDASEKRRLFCAFDLYDFLAYGHRPSTLQADNKNHRIIAGITEAYHGNYTSAVNHFRKALTLHNKTSGYSVKASKQLPFDVQNYYFVLSGYLSGSDPGLKSAESVGKYADTVTMANAVYAMFLHNESESKLKARQQALVSYVTHIGRTFGALLAYYLGNQPQRPIEAEWLILKHEMRQYVPLNAKDEAAANSHLAESRRTGS